MATFPGAVWSPTTWVDNVDEVVASIVNNAQNEIVALETLARQANNNLLPDTLTNEASWQAGTTFSDATDDTYLGGLWNNLNTTNPPDWTQQAGGASDPFEYYLRCTHDADSQAGIVQFIEAKDTKALRGKTITVSADLWGTGVTSLRMAVLEWAGTADSLTSDVVGTWGTGNPTLAANWTYIGTPAAITISGTRGRKSVANLAVGASTNNLAVFIWTDAVEANTDLWNVARVKLEISEAATDFVARPIQQELARIRRLYQKSYDLDIAPGSVSIPGAEMTLSRVAIAASTAGTIRDKSCRFDGSMRDNPTVILYASQTGTANAVSNITGGTDRAGATAANSGHGGYTHLAIDNSSANAIAADSIIAWQWTADSRL